MIKSEKEITELSLATGIPIRELNKLNHLDWYHGTTYKEVESLYAYGAMAMYNIGTPLDFGPGFYLTNTFEKAANYISRVPTIIEGMIPAEKCVVQYSFSPLDVLFAKDGEPKINFTYFRHHDADFAKFVFANRTQNQYNEKPHGFSLIWGVMSDSFPDKIIIDYENGDITYEHALELLQKPNSMWQLYLGTQTLCDKLRIEDVIPIKKEEN